MEVTDSLTYAEKCEYTIIQSLLLENGKKDKGTNILITV